MKPLDLKRCKVIPGKFYRTPKEVWGFRSAPGHGTPSRIARAFLGANAEGLGIQGGLGRLSLRKVVHGLGARHVIFEQQHLGLRIFRAYVTVHIGRDRRAYLVKSRAVPRDHLPGRPRFVLKEAAARRRALRSVAAKRATLRVLEHERLWYPARTRLHAAYKFRIHRDSPRSEWIIYVDAVTGGILSRYDNLAVAKGTATVFDPSPVLAAPDWVPLTERGVVRRPPPEAYRRVTLGDLEDTGYLDGKRVSTRRTRNRVRRRDRVFDCTSTEPGFDEAMVYFHVDRAIRYLERIGYRGPRAIFREPIEANAHGTRDDNSWYSPGERRLTFGTGGVDDAEDAETVLHEFGHAIQDAICPDFGQSLEAAAMGEGFGDYFAASFFFDRKPARYRPTVCSWDCVTATDSDPPCLRRLDTPTTYESFDHSTDADEHENGMIWSATLWEIRRALGRAIADRIIIDSHFQLDGFASFAKAARAILDADRNLYRGRHLARLKRIFRARGIGPVE